MKIDGIITEFPSVAMSYA